MPAEGTELGSLLQCLPLCTPSIWLFLSYILYNKPLCWSKNQGHNHKCQKHGQKNCFSVNPHRYTTLWLPKQTTHPISNCFYHSKATVHLDFTGKTKVNFMRKTFACLPGVRHHILGIFLITNNRKNSILFETFISMDAMPRMQTCMIRGWQISLTSKLLFLTGPWKTKTTFLLSMLLPYCTSYKKYMTPEVPLEFPSEPWNTPRRTEPPWMRLTFPANTGSTLNSKTCFQVFF